MAQERTECVLDTTSPKEASASIGVQETVRSISDREVLLVFRCQAVTEYACALAQGRRDQLTDPLAAAQVYSYKGPYGGFDSAEDQSRATEVLTEKLRPLAEAAGLRAETHETLVYQFLRPEFIAPKSFIVPMSTGNSADVERVVLRTFGNEEIHRCRDSSILQQEQRDLLLAVMEYNPLLGLGVLLQRGLALQEPDRSSAPEFAHLSPAPSVRGWYLKGIDHAAKAHHAIGKVFSEFERRVDNWQTLRMKDARSSEKRTEIAGDTEQVNTLLHLWKEDICGVLFESVMMLSVFASHNDWMEIRHLPALSYWPRFPAKRLNAELDAQLKQCHDRHLHMQALLPELFEPKNMDGTVTLPMQVTVFDAPFFVEFIANYFAALDTEIEKDRKAMGPSRKRQLRSDPNSSAIDLGQFRLLVHPRITPDHEARIAISKSGSEFSLRIDFDRRGRIGFDVGGIDIEKALAVAKIEVSPGTLPSYDKLVDDAGNFRDDRTGKRQSRVAHERFTTLTEGQRASLLFATFASCGFTLGTRKEIPVSHHNRESIRDNWSESEFAHIANCLSKALSMV